MTKETIVQYKCDRCNKTYEDEKLAIACESSHIRKDEIKIISTSHWNFEYSIPNKLILTIGEDNKIFIYEFKETI